jgi:hypothetical protein
MGVHVPGFDDEFELLDFGDFGFGLDAESALGVEVAAS